MILPGLTLSAMEPLWIGSLDRGRLTEELTAYNHVINALGGYWSMSFTVAGDERLMEDWIADGLGRHMVLHDDALVVAWEGFANQIVVNDGPLTVTRGSLLNVANQVDLVYSTVDSTTTPPTVGLRTNTGYANDLPSQALYGILPEILSTGGVDEVVGGEATQILNVFLEEHKLPKTSQQWGNASPGSVSVTVNCLGYVHWLNYPYEQLGVGTVNTSAKIIDVLQNTPNLTVHPAAWLAFNTTDINTNAVQISQNEEEDNIAWGIVKDAVAYGGAGPGYARWTFGVYDLLKARFAAIPDTVEYEALLSDPKLRINLTGGSEVYPWNVLPAKWLMYTDFLPGYVAPTTLREDPRIEFIESVMFTAPDDVVVRGGNLETLSQILAQIGISGVGA